jgi:thioredoxin 1
MAHVSEITSKNFNAQVLESDLPVLVDLYATWCPPCKVMGEVLDKLAPELAGRAKVVKVNVDTEPQLAAAFGVTGVPTLALMHKGKKVDGHVGLTSAKAILKMIEKVSPAAIPLRVTAELTCCSAEFINPKKRRMT